MVLAISGRRHGRVLPAASPTSSPGVSPVDARAGAGGTGPTVHLRRRRPMTAAVFVLVLSASPCSVDGGRSRSARDGLAGYLARAGTLGLAPREFAALNVARIGDLLRDHGRRCRRNPDGSRYFLTGRGHAGRPLGVGHVHRLVLLAAVDPAPARRASRSSSGDLRVGKAQSDERARSRPRDARRARQPDQPGLDARCVGTLRSEPISTPLPLRVWHRRGAVDGQRGTRPTCETCSACCATLRQVRSPIGPSRPTTICPS